MKKLQNNFTTLEQSKRLLELGVPEWAADCLIRNNAEKDKPTIRVKEPYTGYYFANDEYIPCWSVGRLMEIISVCYTQHGWESYMYDLQEGYTCESWVTAIENLMHDNKLDFSKLEE